MALPRIHLVAPAGSCRPFFEAIGVASAAELIAIVQTAVGPAYRISGNEALIDAMEDKARGGRTDDRQRAEDIEQTLADDAVAAMVALRGGAWFARVLPRIDFSVLGGRTRPIAVFGFSEMTTLVNIVGASPHGLGIYDMGPAFLTYGLRRHATMRRRDEGSAPSRPADFAHARLRPEFDAFFHDVTAMIEGRGTDRTITARVAYGDVPGPSRATFVGGNLTVLSTLVGSAYDGCIRPAGQWLVLEDFNDKLERVDRFLAHLTLAHYWDECEGILLGDFHKGYEDLTPAVRNLLPYHLPADRSIPILITRQVGHVWPMSPLPLHLPVTVERIDEERVALRCPPSALRTV